ncbi:hypothetical protein FQA47_013294 [Oryzias melastigma]|uniref:Uncharacterized protein n=1 Tax=Oryzias melastigma TaxID=30732 RepID=A0A834C2X5_ORYME|nr:hypothetical protein FQA47_013294 [Oryzias melastigma]
MLIFTSGHNKNKFKMIKMLSKTADNPNIFGIQQTFCEKSVIMGSELKEQKCIFAREQHRGSPHINATSNWEFNETRQCFCKKTNRPALLINTTQNIYKKQNKCHQMVKDFCLQRVYEVLEVHEFLRQVITEDSTGS